MADNNTDVKISGSLRHFLNYFESNAALDLYLKFTPGYQGPCPSFLTESG